MSFSSQVYDLVVVGGGILGLATARSFLKRYPGKSLAVIEREAQIATQQTGHNSGVIHAGIYYKPGSLKAQACVAGHRAMLEYCTEHDIPYQKIGKLIVALDESEIPRLMELWERGNANGVPGLRLIEQAELGELEPNVQGIRAIFSPETGIVDYQLVAQQYAHDILDDGGSIHTDCQVVGLSTQATHTIIDTPQGVLTANRVITCSGLYSDKVRAMTHPNVDMKIIPFRGSYYKLTPQKQHIVQHLLYPVPDPSFPFLGVHFTPTMAGEVLVGPNAVLAFARQAYTRRTIHLGELIESLTYGGFWRLAGRYWKTGFAEMWRDFVKPAYIREVQRYIPALHAHDLLPAMSGVRAQAMTPQGDLVDDFRIVVGDHIAHVQNAPSPGATSSLIIAEMLLDKIELSLK